MIITKENGTVYTELTKNIIDFHFDNNLNIAWVERPLSYDKESNEYINDITQDESEKGIKKIREFMYKNYTDSLFFKVQRGELDNQIWLDEIQKIKDNYKLEL